MMKFRQSVSLAVFICSCAIGSNAWTMLNLPVALQMQNSINNYQINFNHAVSTEIKNMQDSANHHIDNVYGHINRLSLAAAKTNRIVMWLGITGACSSLPYLLPVLYDL